MASTGKSSMAGGGINHKVGQRRRHYNSGKYTVPYHVHLRQCNEIVINLIEKYGKPVPTRFDKNSHIQTA